MTGHGAVFLAALGAEAERLHPEILARMRREAGHDAAEGVFAVAGSRFGRLAALATPVVGPGLIMTRYGRDVPFRIDTVAGRSPVGRPTLAATREFRFPRGVEHVSDRLVATGHPGILRNALGARGRVEMLEECSVTADGALRMRSRAVALRAGRRRIALRGLLRIDVEVVDGWDETRRRRTVEMRATSPVLGTILEYRGWYRPAEGAEDASAADAEDASGRDQ